MMVTSILKKGLFAATAAATLLLALPSQAGQPYCPPPHGYQHDHRGDYRYGRPPVRKVVVVQHRHHHGDRRRRHGGARTPEAPHRRGIARRWRARRVERRQVSSDC